MGFRPDPQLQQSLPCHRPGRLLDPLAHQPVHLVPRLRLHPAGRQPARHARMTYRNLFITFLDLRHLARRRLDLCHLGGSPCLRSDADARTGAVGLLPRTRSEVRQAARVFIFVCFAWIFFRASSLADAFLICGRIFSAAWNDPAVPALMLVLVLVVWLYQFLLESPVREFLRPASFEFPLRVAMVVYHLHLFLRGRFIHLLSILDEGKSPQANCLIFLS